MPLDARARLNAVAFLVQSLDATYPANKYFLFPSLWPLFTDSQVI